MSYMPPPPYTPPWPGVPGVDPLAGGSLSIGPTGLRGLAPLPAPTPLPYATPLTYQPGGGLAAQVPVGVGQQAARGALSLGPAPTATPPPAGVLSRLPSVAALPRPAPGTFKYVGTPKAIGFGLAGTLGAGVLDNANIGGEGSLIDQFLPGAAQGAGVGASFGPWGALAGGIGGGAISVLSNIFGGDDEPDVEPIAVLTTAIEKAGLDPVTAEQILQGYDTQIALALGIEDEAMREAAIQSAFEQTGQMVLQAMMTQQQAAQQVPGQVANTLALQQQAQQIFEPLAQDIETTGQLYAQAMSGIRDNLPESYRAISDATVARELTSADRLANAYRAQAALTPVAQRLTQYQADQQQYASQLFSQMLAQNAAGVTGGGGTNDDLLNRLSG